MGYFEMTVTTPKGIANVGGNHAQFKGLYDYILNKPVYDALAEATEILEAL